MGLFGKIGRALTGPGGDGLSLLDRAAIFATAAEGDPQTALALRQIPMQRRQEQQRMSMLNHISGLLQPGYAEQAAPQVSLDNPEQNTAAGYQYQPPVRTRDPLNVNSPELPLLALQAKAMGVDVSSLLDVLKAQQPEYDYIRGQRIIKRGAGSGGNPDYITELDKGMRPGAGGVIENAPGYVNAAAEAAGAVTGAQEGAKARLDVITLNMPDGSTVQVPRDIAVQGLIQGLAGGGGGGLGRSRAPEATALATGRATNTVKQEGMVGEATVQAGLDLPKVRDQAQNTLNVLSKIRAHPSLSDRTGNSTLLPALRPEDVDFDVMVRQIGGGAFLEAIQSLKGAGQITEIEGQKATDAIARMQNQRQSQAGFLTAMKDYEDIVRKGLSRTERRAGAPSSATRWTPEQARAELARRRAARGQ